MSSCPPSLQQLFYRNGIASVYLPEELSNVVAVAQALYAGGIEVIEIPLRSPISLQAIERVVNEVKGMTVAAGTVLNKESLQAAQRAGAHCAMSPGTNPRTCKAAQDMGMPFIPGVITPSDIERALESDCTLMKFFPCEISGGLSYLKQVATPFLSAHVQFIPLGGIHLENASSYLQESYITMVGGSWLTPRNAVHSRQWQFITDLAHHARERVNILRGQSH